MDHQDITNTVNVLRTSYKKYYDNRSRTVLMTNKNYFDLLNGQADPLPSKEKERKEPKKRPPSTSQVCDDVRCRAYKMDGNKCNAKIKIRGNEFCARHSKKT
jgi:hypothetical protein